jgi:hypothetical protein
MLVNDFMECSFAIDETKYIGEITRNDANSGVARRRKEKNHTFLF